MIDGYYLSFSYASCLRFPHDALDHFLWRTASDKPYMQNVSIANTYHYVRLFDDYHFHNRW